MTIKARLQTFALATLAAALCPMGANASPVTLNFNIVAAGEQVEIRDYYKAQHVVFGSNSFALGGVQGTNNSTGVLYKYFKCIEDVGCDDPASLPAPEVELRTTDGFYFDRSLQFDYWAQTVGIFVEVFDDQGNLLNTKGSGIYGTTDAVNWAAAVPTTFERRGTRIKITGEANFFGVDNLVLDVVNPNPPPLPEPASYALVMMALAASAATTRRRNG